VAEEVEKVDPDLVARDEQGKPYTVRYEAVNTMLLNEFLKEHRKVEEQATTIAQQRKTFQASITKVEATVAQQQKDFQSTAAQQQKQIQALTASLKEQAVQIQKVSSRMVTAQTAQNVLLNDQ
jgi:septal ring factor EnvC (AmiA/AmiB activator)